jgi:hypothetical protein
MEGRAPHARKEGITPTPTLPLLGSPASRQLLPNHDPPRFRSSLAKRTHRVRPSDKNAFRVIWGLSPLGDPPWGWPRRGGAGSARPQGRHHANPNIAPFGPRADPQRTRREWNASAFARPYDADAETASLRENQPLTLSSGFPRYAIRAGLAPCGGAGSARPRGRPGLGRGVFLLGYLRFACLPGLMRGLDLRRGLRTRARWTHASENPTFPTPLACPQA